MLEQIEKANSNLNTDELDNKTLKTSNKLKENDLRKKTGNLIGSYRNFKQNIRNISSTPADFKLFGSYPSNDEDEQFYAVNRPRTAPHEIIKFETKKSRHKKEKYGFNFKKETEENNKPTKYCHSDIYPVRKTNVVMNEYHDFRLDIGQIKDLAVKDFQLQLNDSSLDKETLTDQEKSQINSKSIQVNDFEIKKYLRGQMENRIGAQRLEVSENIVEKLITSALLAGSNENITVNCLLFSGSDL